MAALASLKNINKRRGEILGTGLETVILDLLIPQILLLVFSLRRVVFEISEARWSSLS